jgi:hypothetical protein
VDIKSNALLLSLTFVKLIESDIFAVRGGDITSSALSPLISGCCKKLKDDKAALGTGEDMLFNSGAVVSGVVMKLKELSIVLEVLLFSFGEGIIPLVLKVDVVSFADTDGAAVPAFKNENVELLVLGAAGRLPWGSLSSWLPLVLLLLGIVVVELPVKKEKADTGAAACDPLSVDAALFAGAVALLPLPPLRSKPPNIIFSVTYCLYKYQCINQLYP